jgi:hypothetical protein
MSRRLAIDIGLVVAFALLGIASRFALQATETRLQILAAWVLALAVDRIGKPAVALRPSRTWCALTAASATAGMLTVRWHLEGLCPHHYAPHCLP